MDKIIIADEVKLREVLLEIFNEFIAQTGPLSNESTKVEDGFITRKEAADILRIALPTLDKYSSEGVVTKYRIGSKVRYKKSEVLKAIQPVKLNKYRTVA